MINNIHRVLDQADRIDVCEGMVAFYRYNEQLQLFARAYGMPLDRVVAAFVSLSPNNSYSQNLRSLVSVLDGVVSNEPVELIRVSTYNHCRDRAYRYAQGRADFLSLTKGPKVRAFYQNILDPTDQTPVTVDGHMISVYQGKRVSMKEAIYLRMNYEQIAHAFRCVAFMRGLIPNQAQAICWFAWKRLNNILVNYQMDLFAGNDQWKTVTPVECIKPYARYDHVDDSFCDSDSAVCSVRSAGSRTLLLSGREIGRTDEAYLWSDSTDAGTS